MAKWTPEPWVWGSSPEADHYFLYQDKPEATTAVALVQGLGDAARIVAAVNGCAGLSTEALEQGVVKELVAACQVLLKEPSTPATGECHWCDPETMKEEYEADGETPPVWLHEDWCPLSVAKAALAKVEKGQGQR